MLEVAAHDLVVTVLCKVPGCEEEAEDKVGRFAKLCLPHKRARVHADRESFSVAGGRAKAGTVAPSSADGELGKRGVAVAKLARKLERAGAASRETRRAEFRLAWLQLGAAAGVLPRRSS
jgi:hypothetical protein